MRWSALPPLGEDHVGAPGAAVGANGDGGEHGGVQAVVEGGRQDRQMTADRLRCFCKKPPNPSLAVAVGEYRFH